MLNTLENLGIIILNYNSSELCINIVKKLTSFHMNAHIFLVDNCSTDNSFQEFEHQLTYDSHIHLVLSPNNSGYANGNNIGIREAIITCPKIDTFLIMNPDIDIDDATVLFALYDCLLKNNKIGAITAKTIYNGRINKPNDCAWHFLSKTTMIWGGTLLGKLFVKSLKYKDLQANEDGIAFVDVVQGCFFMIRKSTFESVDFFDPNTFLYSEESILAKKLEKAGYKNAVLTTYYIHHNHKEKDIRLVNKKNKIFDMKCFYSSRKYYITKYSEENLVFVLLARLVLDIDYSLKRALLLFKKR